MKNKEIKGQYIVIAPKEYHFFSFLIQIGIFELIVSLTASHTKEISMFGPNNPENSKT